MKIENRLGQLFAESMYQLDILVGGKPVKRYSHNDKVFVEAKVGSEYAIRIKNNTWKRVLIACSVDGINVLTGQAAGSDDTGYVVTGYNSVEIKGFRTSNDAVNAFKFSDKSRSYAAKSDQTGGDTSNCGTIGVRVYDEKTYPVVYTTTNAFDENVSLDPVWNGGRYSTWDMRCGAKGNDGPQGQVGQNAAYCCFVGAGPTRSIPHLDVGTEFSNHEISDRVSDTTFNIGELSLERVIYYASAQSLESYGVRLERQSAVAFPTAFPSRFCKPPR